MSIGVFKALWDMPKDIDINYHLSENDLVKSLIGQLKPYFDAKTEVIKALKKKQLLTMVRNLYYKWNPKYEKNNPLRKLRRAAEKNKYISLWWLMNVSGLNPVELGNLYDTTPDPESENRHFTIDINHHNVLGMPLSNPFMELREEERQDTVLSSTSGTATVSQEFDRANTMTVIEMTNDPPDEYNDFACMSCTFRDNSNYYP